MGKVFDVSPVAEGAVLPIVPPHEVLALDLKPVDDRVGILLYRSSEDDKIVPFTNLPSLSARNNGADRVTYLL